MATKNRTSTSARKKATKKPDFPQILSPEAALNLLFYGRLSIMWPWAAILLQIAVITLLICPICFPIYIRSPGVLSSADHTLYVTGITIFATLVTTYTSGQIRKLWVYISATPSNVESSLSKPREIGVLIGLAPVIDQISLWPISLAILLGGLITTAIVTGLAPTSATVFFDVPAYGYPNHNPDCFFVGSYSDGGWWAWELENGTWITLNVGDSVNCSAHYVQPLLANLNSTPSGFAYLQGTVPVSKNATGVPYDVFSGGFSRSFGPLSLGYYGGNPMFLWATQCLPSVTQNPVSCQRTLDVVYNNYTLSINGSNCNGFFSGLPSNALAGSTYYTVCTEDRKPGLATILLAATNGFAAELADMMLDPQFVFESDQMFDENQTSIYGVECNVDVAPTVSLKRLNYSRLNSVEGFDPDIASQVTVADDPTCASDSNSASPYLSKLALATGASASWELLNEATSEDWFDTLSTAASVLNNTLDLTPDGEPIRNFIFNNSKNPLEDAFGLASAIALSIQWGTNLPSTSESSDLLGSQIVKYSGGKAALSGVRVGPGKWWAVVFIIPSCYAITMLGYLLWRLRKLPQKTTAQFKHRRSMSCPQF